MSCYRDFDKPSAPGQPQQPQQQAHRFRPLLDHDQGNAEARTALRRVAAMVAGSGG